MSVNYIITTNNIKKALCLRLGKSVTVNLGLLDNGSVGIRIFTWMKVWETPRLIGTFQRPNTKPELDLLVEEIYHLWVFGG